MKALMNPPDGGRRQHILWAVAAVLLLVGAAYLGRGFTFLLLQRYSLTDFKHRWGEQRYVYNGQNPYDVVELIAAQHAKQPPPECSRDNRVDPRIGPLYFRQGGYPPWAFVTGALFVLPAAFPIACNYYAVLNALALVLTFLWAYHMGRSHSRASGLVLGAAALAIFGNYKTLQVGQYGILVNGLLIGLYYLLVRHRRWLAGVAYGMAALKPQISALFAIIFLVRRQWASLLAATAYIGLASLGTWALTKTNPIEMLSQMYDMGQKWVDSSYSTFTQVLVELHVDKKIVTPVVAILGLLSTGVLMWLWRNGSMLTLFAIAATIGRLWSYHRNYDDVMLIFLVVALGKTVLARPSLWTVFAFILVGLTLWVPVPSLHKLYPLELQLIQIFGWLFGLAVLLANQPRFSPREDEPDAETHDNRPAFMEPDGLLTAAQR